MAALQLRSMGVGSISLQPCNLRTVGIIIFIYILVAIGKGDSSIQNQASNCKELLF